MPKEANSVATIVDLRSMMTMRLCESCFWGMLRLERLSMDKPPGRRREAPFYASNKEGGGPVTHH